MPGTSTIVVAREDLSIPGTEPDKQRTAGDNGEIERRFFELLRTSRPDVILLDLSTTKGNGIAAIRKIRERCGVPVLVVCSAKDSRGPDYRVAGAADCIPAPVDIVLLNRTIQHIKRLTSEVEPEAPRQPEAYTFAGLMFRPDQNALSGPTGIKVKLTTSEGDVLSHFLLRAWTVCSRAEIAQILYGRHRPTSDRAIDVIVNRLRKKLAAVRRPDAENLVKTEFRRGYMLVADVSKVSQLEGSQRDRRDAR